MDHIKRLNEQISTLNKSVTCLESTIQEKDQEVTALKDTIASSQNNVATLTTERDELATRSSLLEATLSEKEEHIQKLEKAKITQGQLTANLAKANDTIDKLQHELEGGKDRVIQLERSIKARNIAGAAVECLTSAKAVKEEEQKSSKLATISDKLCSANNSLKDKEVEIDELRKVNNAISVKLEVTNDELSNANDTLKEKEAIIVEMSNKQHAKDVKLATAEQENAAMAAELAMVKTELRNLKTKTLFDTIGSTVYNAATEIVSYMPFRKKRKISL